MWNNASSFVSSILSSTTTRTNNFNDLCPFVKQIPLDERLSLSNRLIKTYPDKVALILFSDKVNIKKNRFLADSSLEFGNFVYSARKELKLDLNPQESYFFLITKDPWENVNKAFAVTNGSLDRVRDKYRSSDGFVYIYITLENVYGR